MCDLLVDIGHWRVNCIVRTNMSKAYKQKNPIITTLCFPCRKACHLINSHQTLKNVYNGLGIKRLDGRYLETANIVYEKRCKILVIFISSTLERNWGKDSTNTCTMPTTDKITMNLQPTLTNTNTTLTKILKFLYWREIYIKNTKENYVKTNLSVYWEKKSLLGLM